MTNQQLLPFCNSTLPISNGVALTAMKFIYISDSKNWWHCNLRQSRSSIKVHQILGCKGVSYLKQFLTNKFCSDELGMIWDAITDLKNYLWEVCMDNYWIQWKSADPAKEYRYMSHIAHARNIVLAEYTCNNWCLVGSAKKQKNVLW